MRPTRSLAESFETLQRCSMALTTTAEDVIDRYRKDVWGVVFERARADVHAAATDVVAAMDPRFREIATTAAGPTIVSIFLEGMSIPLASHTVGIDEIAFGAFWTDHGCPSFELTRGLMSELLLTDPGKVAEADVPWPFPAFRVQLPSPSPLSFISPTGDTPTLVQLVDFNVLRWAANHRTDSVIEAVSLAPLFGAADMAGFRKALHRVMDKVLDATEPEDVRPERLLVRGYARTAVSLFNNQPWQDGDCVQAWFDGAPSTRQPGTRPMSGLKGAEVPLEPVDRAASLAMQRLAVNLALYLQSEGEDGKPTWTPDMKPQGRNGRLWTVGRSVKVSREVHEAADAVAAGRVASCPSVRHIVRGHFREQAHGPRWSLRKRMYIKPFWRCQEGAEGQSRVYKVQ